MYILITMIYNDHYILYITLQILQQPAPETIPSCSVRWCATTGTMLPQSA